MNLLLLLLIGQIPAAESLPPDLRVAAFFAVECPLAKLYAQRLNELQAEFPQVEFDAYAPNRQDDDARVAAFQKIIDFPIRRGATEAARLHATFSPEVFLIQGGKVVYSGRIDDQYSPGKHRPRPAHRYLAGAIADVLAKRRVANPRVAPEGCRLNLESTPVAPAENALAVVHARCATCHHPGTAAPFSLLTGSDVHDWRETIVDVIAQGRMPPWGAEGGEFANDRRLTADERRILLPWIDAGCPDAEGPEPPRFSNGWSFAPDLVFEAPPFHVPATGTLDYQEFRLPIFSSDTWVSAVEMRGSRAVHHINALIEPANADPGARYLVTGDHYLATMVTGNPGIELPAGMAKLIPATWRIKLEVHYEPTGEPVVDQSRIALKLSAKPEKRVITQMLLKSDIVLPPNAETTDRQEWRLDKEYTLLAIFPHMHLRGKAMRVEAQLPGGPAELLLDVPRYDYAWQDRYVLAAPRPLPAGTVIHVSALWDNTAGNSLNPDPNQTVRAGRQATDEMFQCSLDVYETPKRARAPSLWLALLAIGLVFVWVRTGRTKPAG
jgi:hypothetical protein